MLPHLYAAKHAPMGRTMVAIVEKIDVPRLAHMREEIHQGALSSGAAVATL